MTAEAFAIPMYVLTALSVGLFAYLAASARSSGEVAGAVDPRAAAAAGPFERYVIPMAKALAPLHQGAIETQSGKDLDRLLKRAGRPFGLKVAEFLGLRYVAAGFGMLFGYLISIQLSGSAEPIMVLLFAGVGFMYPGMSLKGAAERRVLKIFRDMPNVLDLLTLSTEAGLDFSSAMGMVVEKGSPGPLVEEFRIAHQEVTLGKTRSDSLRAMADRIDLQEMTSFVLALLQAEQLGTSVGAVLRTMADQMRVKRALLAEELAGKVPVKLMLPLVVCVFPASFIILFVPLFLDYQTGGGF